MSACWTWIIASPELAVNGLLCLSSTLPDAVSCVKGGIINSALRFSFFPPENEPVLQQFYGLGAAKFTTFDFRSGVVLEFGYHGGADGFLDNYSSLCVFKFFGFADSPEGDNHSAIERPVFINLTGPFMIQERAGLVDD